MKALISLARDKQYETFFTAENEQLAASLGDMLWNAAPQPLTKAEVIDRIADCDCYVTLWGSPRLDADILAHAPRLRLLTHLAGTIVPFVSDAMWDRGIRVISGNSYFAESVAEGTVGYMLAALRDIPYYSDRLKREHVWKRPEDFPRGLLGRTVGLVSYGEIARHLVRLLAPFRVRIKVYDVAPLPADDVAAYGLQAASLEEIFSTCDVVSLHTPLYDATYHLIGRDLLRLLRPGSLFLNTSRGAVVDQSALEQELATGRFRAVLDVYEQEPPADDCPLYAMDNVLMMPHMGGPTVDLRSHITHDLLLESAAYLDHNEPLRHEITRARAQHMSSH